MSNVIPTRMELLKKKGQIKLAKKGYNLLKKKRDALVLEFFKILKKAKNLRKELNESLKEARHSIYYASILTTSLEIEVLAGLNKGELEIDVKEKNVMGVKIPRIEHKLRFDFDHPEFLLTSQLYNVAKNYMKIIEIIVEIAEIETAVKRMLKEIEKTKRRVNALEYILIPRFEDEVKLIKQRLEELERDSFVSLKAIKRKLEKEKSSLD